MIITIGTICGIVFGIFNNMDNGKCGFDNTARTLGTGMVGFVIGFFIAIILPMDTTINTYEYEIVSLKQNTDVGEDIYLRYGKIDGQMEYKFYYRINNGIKSIQLESSDVILKFGNEPTLIIYKEEPTDAFINNFAFGIKDFLSIEYKIIIPEKSFRRNYTLSVD
jgi:hypothetical protein